VKKKPRRKQSEENVAQNEENIMAKKTEESMAQK